MGIPKFWHYPPLQSIRAKKQNTLSKSPTILKSYYTRIGCHVRLCLKILLLSPEKTKWHLELGNLYIEHIALNYNFMKLMKITLSLTLPSISTGEETKQQPSPLRRWPPLALPRPSQSCENIMLVLGLSPRNGVCFLSYPFKVFTRNSYAKRLPLQIGLALKKWEFGQFGCPSIFLTS